ncbi:hypothetical protein MXAN_6730 [Myxococcus xanthus DK 1622]|uniref:Uncharacterized protein n=1 Tax=Myxococcus xanthus (strain DK1622) TaxID=246197 RepID=Q1CXM6_MYXXD|nr:hypothetical protein MXAN_6730 [Myxococcus xanthus DK 1622]
MSTYIGARRSGLRTIARHFQTPEAIPTASKAPAARMEVPSILIRRE